MSSITKILSEIPHCYEGDLNCACPLQSVQITTLCPEGGRITGGAGMRTVDCLPLLALAPAPGSPSATPWPTTHSTSTRGRNPLEWNIKWNLRTLIHVHVQRRPGQTRVDPTRPSQRQSCNKVRGKGASRRRRHLLLRYVACARHRQLEQDEQKPGKARQGMPCAMCKWKCLCVGKSFGCH